MTFWRPSRQKSMSTSGMEIRSGLRNRSNSRSYCMGSMSVMCIDQATMLPAALPRPGPTGTPISRALRMKSQTSRK